MYARVRMGVQLKSEKNIFLFPEGVFIIKLADLMYFFVFSSDATLCKISHYSNLNGKKHCE